MNEGENLDISKVVGLIMENPQLIEQIANLAKPKENEKEPLPSEIIKEETQEVIAENPPPQPTYSERRHGQSDRAKLLGALKPYVSEDRAKAIDSMISIAEILDMMRSR